MQYKNLITLLLLLSSPALVYTQDAPDEEVVEQEEVEEEKAPAPQAAAKPQQAPTAKPAPAKPEVVATPTAEVATTTTAEEAAEPTETEEVAPEELELTPAPAEEAVGENGVPERSKAELGVKEAEAVQETPEQPEQEKQEAVAEPAEAVVPPPTEAIVPEEAAIEQPQATQQPAEPGVEPTREKAAPLPEAAVDYGPGIDTIDIESGGNWLIKRVIWEDAERLYEKLQELNHRVLDGRIEFFVKRSTSDKELNLFYVSIGFSQGELEEILNSLLALLEKERAHQGSLSEQERALYAQLMEKKNDLEQLRTDMKALVEFDGSLDNALTQLIQQINLANTYEKQAWHKFKEIGQELDDKKAKEYYAHMETAYKNTLAIEDYTTGPFANYFNSVMQKIMNTMSSIKTRLDSLKQSGIELKTQLDEFEKARRTGREPQAEKPIKKVEKTGWYDSVAMLWRYPISFFQWLMSFWYGLFTGKN